MKRFLLTFLLLIILPFQLLRLYEKTDDLENNDVAGIQSRSSESVINWVAIGDYRFTLFGYTSPFAVVTFDGQGIHDQTIADSTGYFEMANRFSPFSPREACLSSKDQLGRISSPVCLPPFPTKYTVSIGPVLIPPTLSLNRNEYYTDDKIVLSGQTIPDSEVVLSVFTKENGLLSTRPDSATSQKKASTMPFKGFNLVKPVDAFSFPELSAKSDKEGNFSLSLPSSHPQSFRLFAQTDFMNNNSGESIKLNFKVYPIWMIIIRFLLSLLELIKSRLLEILIAIELIYISWFIYKHWFHHAVISRALMILPNEAIVLHSEFPLVKKDDYPIKKESEKFN